MADDAGANQLDNATVGAGTVIEPGVTVGLRYHPDCGPARVGSHGILRQGTIIYGDVVLGDYFQSGHHVVIRAKVRAGDYCTVSNHSVLEGLIRFGTGVRVMSNVYIPSRTWVGDHVFLGPGITFLNDRYPGRWEGPMPTPRSATIEDDVMIGGGCTILPGLTIGERSFIAAGATVIRDVPPRSLVKGCPGVVEPLPKKLDRAMDRALTVQPFDFWHPDTPDLAGLTWPDDWPERWEDTQP